MADRSTFIGASDVPVIMGMSPFKTYSCLMGEKLGMVEPQPDSLPMQVGRALEPMLLHYAMRELGACRTVGYQQHESQPYFKALPDGQVVESLNLVEIKTSGICGPAMEDWGKFGTDEIPLHYMWQVQAQLACVAEASLCHLVALIAGRGVGIYNIRRSTSAIIRLEREVDRFWGQVTNLKNRKMDWGALLPYAPLTYAEAKRLIKTPGKEVVVGVGPWPGLEKLAQVRKAKSRVKQYEEFLKAALLTAMGDAECITFDDGTRLEHKQYMRSGYTVEPSTYRRLHIKKGESCDEAERLGDDSGDLVDFNGARVAESFAALLHAIEAYPDGDDADADKPLAIGVQPQLDHGGGDAGGQPGAGD